MSEKVFVRLRPTDPSKGCLARRYVWRGSLFKAGEWRRVPAAVAAELKKLRQPKSLEWAPVPLFDVGKDAEEAAEIKRRDNPEPATEVDGAQDLSEGDFRGLEKSRAPAPPRASDPPSVERFDVEEDPEELEGIDWLGEESPEQPEESEDPEEKARG